MYQRPVATTTTSLTQITIIKYTMIRL